MKYSKLFIYCFKYPIVWRVSGATYIIGSSLYWSWSFHPSSRCAYFADKCSGYDEKKDRCLIIKTIISFEGRLFWSEYLSGVCGFITIEVIQLFFLWSPGVPRTVTFNICIQRYRKFKHADRFFFLIIWYVQKKALKRTTRKGCTDTF